MNNYKKKCLIAMQLCSIALLGLFVAASVRAQTATAPATDDRSDATITHVSCPELSFATSGFQPGPTSTYSSK